jgi:hypothetical protein
MDRDSAHAKSCAAWDDAGKRSRVDGLAARIRGSGHPPKSAAKRAAERELMRQRQKAAYRVIRVPHVDRSRYFPHQSTREIGRAYRRELVKAAIPTLKAAA